VTRRPRDAVERYSSGRHLVRRHRVTPATGQPARALASLRGTDGL